MRTFVGIPFPQEYKDILRNIKLDCKRKFLSKIKWTEEKNFHLTLYFIGEVDDSLVEKIKDGLDTISTSGFLFQAGGGGFFPGIKRPRVLWVGSVQGKTECMKLQEKVSYTLEKIISKKETRPFRPHLTLGRVKYCNFQDNWQDLLKYLNEISWPQVKVEKFVLWKSTLRPSGPIYTPIKEFHLM